MALLMNILLEELIRRYEYNQLMRNLRDTNDLLQMPEELFRKNFRLSRDATWDLFQEIEIYMDYQPRTTRVPKLIRLIVALNFFAQGSYQKAVGKDHHSALSQATVSRCIKKILTIINNRIAHRYISFPNNVIDMTRIKNGFFEKFNFPGVVGCIDCTHIKIVPPRANDPFMPGIRFVNRKNFHSINCQIVCDADLQIRHINARFPGSVHDEAIWLLSNVRQFLLNNYRNNRDRNTWLLGDSGYTNQPFLLTPIVGAEPDTPNGRYTASHVKVRNTIERCIGVLKSYFRCLKADRVLHYAPVTASKMIYASAVLHNICRKRNIVDEDLENEFDAVLVVHDIDDEDHRDPVELVNEGVAIRNNLIQEVFNL